LLLSFAYALVILGVAGVEWRILTNRWMQLAGEISYGIYILQLPLQRYTYFLREVLPSPTQRDVLLAVVIIPVCYVVFRWFEMPARLYLRRLLTGRPVAARPI
jgi:peptidoglycan/LPS O-acetylase OafA/YrhL